MSSNTDIHINKHTYSRMVNYHIGRSFYHGESFYKFHARIGSPRLGLSKRVSFIFIIFEAERESKGGKRKINSKKVGMRKLK